MGENKKKRISITQEGWNALIQYLLKKEDVALFHGLTSEMKVIEEKQEGLGKKENNEEDY